MDNINEILSGLVSRMGTALPKLLGVIAVLLIGMFVAKIIRRLIAKGLSKTGVDNLQKNADSKHSLSSTIAKIIYYILLIYVLVFALGMLGMTDVLAPLQDMLSQFMGFIPNLIGAGLIGFIGFTIANIVKEGVAAITSGLNSLGERYGMSTSMNLSKILSQVVFLFVLIPIILVALDTLNFSLISDPAKNMLAHFMEAIPNIIAAAIILFVFLLGGKFISGIVAELLRNLNIDKMAEGLGIASMIGSKNTMSDILSKMLYFYIAFFGIIAAVEKLEFTSMSNTLNDILALTGHILFGMIILIIGNKVSQFASSYFAGSDSPGLSSIARFATLGLFLAISLKYMGIADDIVNLAFGLTLGAIAVAFAISFGLGGREAAGKQMERFFDRINTK